MIRKIDQSLLLGDGSGDCFAACIATVLGLELCDVPNFCGDHPLDWYRIAAKWLRARGVTPLSIPVPRAMQWALRWAPRSPWIASGPSSIGRHAVVYVGGELFHDPNPNLGRRGLQRVDDALFLLRPH